MPELSGTVHGTIGRVPTSQIHVLVTKYTTHHKDLTIPDFVDLLVHHCQ